MIWKGVKFRENRENSNFFEKESNFLGNPILSCLLFLVHTSKKGNAAKEQCDGQQLVDNYLKLQS